MSDTNYDGMNSGNVNWQHWVNAVAAVWLFISPWVLQFGSAAPAGGTAAQGGAAAAAAAPVAASVGSAAWNAWILGVIIFLVALSNLGRMDFRQGWVNLVLGIWVFIAPWVLGFAGIPNAAWDHWIVGIVVFVFSAWLVYSSRTAITAARTATSRHP
jgi:hypothetical protein